ncbi:lytic murein transglycosylase [Streptomyces sp. NPDC017979]|uniref:lytic transglycosylase domain-containing protein n=1 Tax=Streptomyces sp. NPDC017979 TaxID=3365024 RepID=UPI0037B5D09C
MAAHFGRRLRRGATTTAVAAAAVAALSASQAPGVTHAVSGDSQGSQDEASDATPPPGTPATGDSPYYTDLPPLDSPNKQGTSPSGGTKGAAEAGIPATVLDAYKRAERTIASSDPGCRVPWQLLAAIGKVESGQARGGRVDANGTTLSPILGPVLNGVGFANILDTDNGAYDGDTTHDRAVGPMQFIPSTWASWGQDANGDGRKDPNNIYDAALAAGRYLCANDRDLTQAQDLERAILSYNRSREYLTTVLSWFDYYKRGTHSVPDGSGVLPGSSTPDSGSNSTATTPPAGVTPTPPAGATPPPASGPRDKPEGPAKEPGTEPTKPSTPPSKPSPPTTPPKQPAKPVQVASIENAGTGELATMAGRDFTERVTVRVMSNAGRAMAGQNVRFEIVGPTDAAFADGAKSVVRPTGLNGSVTAPVLKPGDKTGTFTVRARVVGSTVAPVDFTAKVTAPEADKINWVNAKEMTAAPGADFEHLLEAKATHGGTSISGVAVKAELFEVGANGEETPSESGPYFKGADDKPVRTLSDLTTDADGALKLPKIHTDDQAGTFLLRLTAAGGKTLTIELKVVAPAA